MNSYKTIKLVLRYGLVYLSLILVAIMAFKLISVTDALSSDVVGALLGIALGFIGGLIAAAIKDIFNPNDGENGTPA